MNFDVVTLPCLQDNYAYILINTQTNEAALVDVPDAAPIDTFFAQRPELTLTHILLTHHHWDHVDGLAHLSCKAGALVVGAEHDRHRLPPLSYAVQDGASIDLLGASVHVLSVDGHTLGHIAYYVPDAAALFSGDSVMTYGCGRLFEGSAEDMFHSFQKVALLPDETRLFSGHNYAAENLAFAGVCAPQKDVYEQCLEDVAGQNQNGDSASGRLLSVEKAVNPYFRAHLPEVQQVVANGETDPLKVFTKIRANKDVF